ncbi:MAG TPA: HlyD family efflux transporter periplasmic adaptor subunit [Gemmatimonadaceae bacterium]|jgi:multidrug resistance efflux pump|nr:HlyD family efflux transporter periplasmic adaptor subunit [Gemmatimonadaceae bacterium]
MVDIKRDPPKKTKRNIVIGAAIAAVALITVFLSQLEARPPSVNRAELWVDSVVRSDMLRQVRAPGTLVPERIRYVVAVTSGRVEAKPLTAGVTVTPSTLILELSNPDVQLEYLTAQRAVADAEQALVNLQTSLETGILTQQSQVAQTRTLRSQALRDAEVFAALDKRGLSSANEVARAKELASELEGRIKIEEQRLAVMQSAATEQVRLAKTNLDRQRAIERFQAQRVASMKVTAGEEGVLQTLNGELGQWVLAGTVLATVAQPGRLKAVLRVPETLAPDVVPGQRASIDTRNGLVSGHVMRVDPAAQNGTVTVEVALDGALPRGARSDASVDGTIEVERLQNVLHVGRPAYGQPESTVGIFKMDASGNTATRVNVRLGKTSVNTIEIQSGLSPRDSVIISDMTRFDNVQKVRIER